MTQPHSPLRIALLSAEYPPQPGGIGDYTQHLGHSLAARGLHISAWTIADQCFTIHTFDNAPSSRQVASAKHHTWSWNSWRAIIAALDMMQPDVLHIQYQTGAYGMHPAINLLPWRLKRRAMRPAIVVTMHDLLLPYLFPKAAPARRWVTQRLLHDADRVIVTNQQDWDQVKQQSGAALSVSRIPIGNNIPVLPPDDFDRAAWRTKLGVQPNDLLVAYFGLLSRNKGVDVLLRALALLPASARLVLIGGAATNPQDRAYAAEQEQLIATLGVGDRIIRTGHISPVDVSAHLLAADAAALPFADGASFRRGSLLAALAHGLPVITTPPPPHDDAHALLQPCSLLVPANDPSALAAAIRQLHNDPALRTQLGSAGRALAAQWDWDAIAAQHEALYQGLF